MSGIKYKFCPDCGSKTTYTKAANGWSEVYDCDQCGLRIRITFGETMGNHPDEENRTKRPIKIKGGE